MNDLVLDATAGNRDSCDRWGDLMLVTIMKDDLIHLADDAAKFDKEQVSEDFMIHTFGDDARKKLAL